MWYHPGMKNIDELCVGNGLSGLGDAAAVLAASKQVCESSTDNWRTCTFKENPCLTAQRAGAQIACGPGAKDFCTCVTNPQSILSAAGQVASWFGPKMPAPVTGAAAPGTAVAPTPSGTPGPAAPSPGAPKPAPGFFEQNKNTLVIGGVVLAGLVALKILTD